MHTVKDPKPHNAPCSPDDIREPEKDTSCEQTSTVSTYTTNPYTTTVVRRDKEDTAAPIPNRTAPVPDFCYERLPLDITSMILRMAWLQERKDRYLARELRYKYTGYIDETDRLLMLQLIRCWNFLDQQEVLDANQIQPMRLIQAHLQKTVRSVFDQFFRPNTDDQLNMEDSEWTQVVFELQAMLPVFHNDGFVSKAEIRATSADGLHRIRFLFQRFPALDHVLIFYVGPQSFATFSRYKDHECWAQDLCILERYYGGDAARRNLRNLDDKSVFEDWERRVRGPKLLLG
jgi:hypothetical protein